MTNESAAIGGDADEGSYTIDVRHVEEMVGTTKEAADGDRVRRGRDGDETGDETDGPGDDTDGPGDETGGPGDETGDKTAVTAGDERDGGDRWGNVYGRRGVRI